MDNLRIVLYIALALVGAMIYGDWQQDYGKQPSLEVAAEAVDVPVEEASSIDQPVATAAPSSAASTPAPAADTGIRTVRVKTDVLDVVLETRGGNLVRSNLIQYPVEYGSEQTIRLQSQSQADYFDVISGLLSRQDSAAPDHLSQFRVDADSFELAAGAETLEVPLVWEANGVKITKTYTFSRSDYLIKLRYTVENQADSEWKGYQYRRLRRVEGEDGSSMFINTYTGGVIYNQEDKYEKISYEDMEEEQFSRTFNNGWAAMIQHYFLTALIPDETEKNRYYSKVEKFNDANLYVLGLTSPEKTAAAGETVEFETQLYIGPKIQDRLEAVAEGLELTVDYGMLTIISKPLFWVLDKIHDYVGNWGWAIIIVTIMIKLIFYPLSEASYRSMAKMRKVTPEMQKIRERYADDRQRQSQELMKLYQKEKINPLGGCLPMLIQIPVFIALYWALLESVELRQAPFILWIKDLSVNDPHFILPLIMGATMYIQQKLNPTPPDPMQAKVFMMMPIVFTFFFMMFPAGLVLYWVTNNTLSILQQWVINRRIEAGADK